MCRPHCTLPSHLAAATTLVTAAVLVPVLATTTHPTYQLIEGTALLAALATATGVRRTDAFEARFLAALVSAAVAGATLLSLTLGVPGAAVAGEPSPTLATLLACGVLTPALVALDWRSRRLRRLRRLATRRPYTL